MEGGVRGNIQILPIHSQKQLRQIADNKLALNAGWDDEILAPDPKPITAIAQGRAWFAEITNGRASSVSERAQRHGVDRTDVGRMISFAFLAPDIVQAILEGRQPVDLTAARLRRVRDLPDSWSEPRKFLGSAR